MIKTGISGFDKVLKGGFPDNSIILFYGPPGIGKTTAGLHYLYQGAKEGICFYAYYGRKNQEVESELKSYGLDIGKLRNKIFMIDTSNVSEGANVINCNLDNLFIVELAIKQFIENNRGKRIRAFIDVLSPALMVNEPVVIYKFFQNIVHALKQNNVSAVFVIQDGVHDGETVAAMAQLCDGIIEFRYLEKDLKIKRLLSIKRVRGRAIDASYHEFQITNRGIKLK